MQSPLSEKPILVFPRPEQVDRSKPRGFPSGGNSPSPSQQVVRISPRISELEELFDRRVAEIRSDPTGAEPEEILVFQTVGTVEDFSRAVEGITGLEFMSDFNVDDIPSNEYFFREGREQENLAGRLYLIMSNQEGLRQLLNLWEIYKSNPDHPSFEYRKGRWRLLFNQLDVIRPWGPEDRLFETGLLEDWNTRVGEGEETVPAEIELWFRSTHRQRLEVSESIAARVGDMGGEIVTESIIQEIRYHAVIARIPVSSVQNISELPESRLVRSSEIMFLRPAGQAVVTVPDGNTAPVPFQSNDLDQPEGEPIVALLDGYPLENHQWLADRIDVDDPDGWGNQIPVEERSHGTAMASLIIHGELDKTDSPIRRKLYIRPIMRPDYGNFNNPGNREAVPDHILPVDLVHRAVRRMFEGEPGEDPVAPTIRIICLAVCEKFGQFYRYPSPWARLLDYLSWKYGVLFIVSAGNHSTNIELDYPESDIDQLRTDRDSLKSEFLTALNREARNRRLLSPSESINSVTIGAVHSDSSTYSTIGNAFDPYQNGESVSPISAQGRGFRRSVKPDILFPGGRQTYMQNYFAQNGKVVLEPTNSAITPPGLRVAAPSPQAGNINDTGYIRGTSGATALASRLGAELFEQIQDLKNEPTGNLIQDEHVASLLKALIVHGAEWGTSASTISNAIPTRNYWERTTLLTRMLGYGAVSRTDLLTCTDQRATIIGCGELTEGKADRYEFPMPASLSGTSGLRRLVITLAWLSPVNPAHNRYRQAELWVNAYGEDRTNGNLAEGLGVSRTSVEYRAARRGTVQHDVLEGERTKLFSSSDSVYLQVNCRTMAGRLTAPVPYALVASLEVAPETGIPIYNQMRDIIRQRVQIRLSS